MVLSYVRCSSHISQVIKIIRVIYSSHNYICMRKINSMTLRDYINSIRLSALMHTKLQSSMNRTLHS